MEGKYIKKDAEVRVSCTQKRCQQAENALKEDLEVPVTVYCSVHEAMPVYI